MLRNQFNQTADGYYILIYQFKNSPHKWMLAFPWVGNNLQEIGKQKMLAERALTIYKQNLQPFLVSYFTTTHNEEITKEKLQNLVDSIM